MQKKYYIENEDVVSLARRKYYIEHQDEKLNKAKQYRDNNKDKIKQYVEEHKEKHRERFVCDICGGRYTYSHKSEHVRSKKHLTAVENNND